MGWGRRTVCTTAAAAGAAAAILALRRVSLRWGATEAELASVLPGDALVPVPDLAATRAVTVAAPPSAVWPWLAQLGQNRGGFYSYDSLENLFGLGIHSANEIRPALQVQQPGDAVNLAPGAGLSVALLEPEHALVLGGGVGPSGAGTGEPDGGADDGAAPFDFSWAFVLLPQPDGSTRLVVRERYAYRTVWAGLMVEPVEMISFLMTQRMLRGIRDRAERHHRRE